MTRAVRYSATKRYPEICVAHRNWRSGTHCALIHGYARTTEITVATDQLDGNNWVIDLGNLRFVRNFLETSWDHVLLVDDDDPLLPDLRQLEAKGALKLHVMDTARGWGPSLEGSGRFIADHIGPEIATKTQGRCWLSKIEIWEKTDNRAALHLDPPA